MPKKITKTEKTKKPAPKKKAEVKAVKKISKAVKPEEKKESSLVKASEKKKPEEKKADKKNEYLYAVGKRKSAIARVRVYKKGAGKIVVNERDYEKVFPRATWQEIIIKPLKLIGQKDKLDVTVKIVGGGTKGQAEAIRHGLSKALIQLNPNFRKPLKKAGYLTRDARKKERKKPGLKGARRAPQWSKR